MYACGWFICCTAEINTTLQSNRACMLSCSVMSDSLQPQSVAHQAPLSMGFSRQEYCSGFPFPSPGTLPYPGTEPEFPTSVGRFFTTEPIFRGKKKKRQDHKSFHEPLLLEITGDLIIIFAFDCKQAETIWKWNLQNIQHAKILFQWILDSTCYKLQESPLKVLHVGG